MQEGRDRRGQGRTATANDNGGPEARFGDAVLRLARLLCTSLHASCNAELEETFDLCIASAVRGCIHQRQTFGICSYDERVAFQCNWTGVVRQGLAGESHQARAR
ncbi:MAG: hypothetical protein OXH60_11440 [Rhodospirillales bacterium]|nr:hypothetical protein [Rhodospirillales bacterium]